MWIKINDINLFQIFFYYINLIISYFIMHDIRRNKNVIKAIKLEIHQYIQRHA